MSIFLQNLRPTIFDFLNDKIEAQILIGLAIMLFVGFLLTRITKLVKLPNVTAYIFAGIILGPVFYAIFKKTLISDQIIRGMSFLTDIALAFIAFNVGRFFKFEVLKESGPKILIITLFESLMAAGVVFVTMRFAFKIQWELSLLLAAIASATAPASTMMTIRQTKAKGDFVNTILQVVALDDAISLILFSISIAIITATADGGGFNAVLIIKPILINIGILILGGVLGYILHKLIIESRTKDNRLIIVISLLLALSGFSAIFDVSPLLGCMAMGAVYLNLSKDTTLFSQIDAFSPAILTLFFVLSGMRLQLDKLVGMGLAGVAYFVVRIIGKYAGASLGSVVANSTENNKKYLGLALIPQAGVSLGLAALGARILENNGMNEQAMILSTIIIASGVLYEIFGPPSAKLSLYLTKSYDIEKERERLQSE